MASTPAIIPRMNMYVGTTITLNMVTPDSITVVVLSPERTIKLRTVPPFVTAHTFCTSRDIWVS